MFGRFQKIGVTAEIIWEISEESLEKYGFNEFERLRFSKARCAYNEQTNRNSGNSKLRHNLDEISILSLISLRFELIKYDIQTIGPPKLPPRPNTLKIDSSSNTKALVQDTLSINHPLDHAASVSSAFASTTSAATTQLNDQKYPSTHKLTTSPSTEDQRGKNSYFQIYKPNAQEGIIIK